MEGNKAIRFLKKHEGVETSTFAEEAAWREENASWLKWSRSVAMNIIDYMQETGKSHSDIAALLGCSPQYVSKILSGKINFSFKTVSEIEEKLGIQCMELA